jgi:hypothetical protein
MALDPILNENLMLTTLVTPLSADDVERLQYGAMMSVVDAFDRKIKREPFCDIVAAALSLHSHLARLHLAMSIEALQKVGKLDEKKMSDATRILAEDGELQRRKLFKLMELVVACPRSDDAVH